MSKLQGKYIADNAITNAKLDDLAVDTAEIAASAVTPAKADLTATWDYSSGTLKAASPSADADVSTKGYVDALSEGLDVKDSVVAATTANGALATAYANAQTVDGVTLATGDRILLKDQTTGTENGIYTVNASGAPARAVDFASAATVAGAFAFAEQGTVNADSGWVCTNNTGSDVVGTDALTFSQFSGAGQITAGAGLTKSGNTIDAVAASNGGITINADSIEVTRDATGGANLAAAIDKNANGLAVRVDDATVEEGTSGQLRVKADGIGAAQLDETATYDFSGSGSVDVATQTAGNSTTKAASTAFVQGEIRPGVIETLTRSAQNVTDGVIGPLTATPRVNDDSVELTPYGAPDQEHSVDYTVRDVTGGSAAGTYIVVATSPTAPGGGTFSGGSNPSAGIDSLVVATDKVKVAFTT